jgi:methylmalonyl-CoA mutase
VPALAKAVKAAKPEVQIVLAGYPADEALKTAYTEAGVDVFIHVRADVPATLNQLLTKVGAEL